MSALILGCLVITACGGPRLRDDFEELPLEGKVDAYEAHIQRGGGFSAKAHVLISWHGWEAADIMAEYLKGERSGLPVVEVIGIAKTVQIRGCSLAGTKVEQALEGFLAQGPTDAVERELAAMTLEAIREDRVLPDEEVDRLDGRLGIHIGGPCRE